MPNVTLPPKAIYEMSPSLQVYWVVISDAPLLLADLAALIIFCRILFYIKWRKSFVQVRPSRPMLIYLISQTFWTTTSIGYPAYNLYRWRPPEIVLKTGVEKHSLADQIILFWTGQFQLNYLATAPIAVLFVTLDRCLTFWPTKRKFLAQKLFYANVFFLISAYLISMIDYLMVLPLNIEILATCRYAACLMKLGSANRVQLFMKNVVCVANLLFSILFYTLLYRYNKSNTNTTVSLRNRFVKFTLIIELFFEIIPSFTTLFFNMVPGYIGYTSIVDIAMALCALDAAFCGFYYSRVFIRKTPEHGKFEVTRTGWKTKIMPQQNNQIALK